MHMARAEWMHTVRERKREARGFPPTAVLGGGHTTHLVSLEEALVFGRHHPLARKNGVRLINQSLFEVPRKPRLLPPRQPLKVPPDDVFKGDACVR